MRGSHLLFVEEGVKVWGLVLLDVWPRRLDDTESGLSESYCHAENASDSEKLAQRKNAR